MAWLRLALKSLKNRWITATLTMVTVAISVALLLSVDRLRREAEDHFSRTVSGTDLIVGARTSPSQLLLSSLFQLGMPSQNVSWARFEYWRQQPNVAWSIPWSLGDSFRGYRVVGTSDAFFKHFRYSDQHPLQWRAGGAFSGPREAVLGAETATRLKIALGASLTIAHGAGEISFIEHDEEPVTVVGILAPTGTPLDRGVYVDLSTLDRLHDEGGHAHDKALPVGQMRADTDAHEHTKAPAAKPHTDAHEHTKAPAAKPHTDAHEHTEAPAAKPHTDAHEHTKAPAAKPHTDAHEHTEAPAAKPHTDAHEHTEAPAEKSHGDTDKLLASTVGEKAHEAHAHKEAAHEAEHEDEHEDEHAHGRASPRASEKSTRTLSAFFLGLNPRHSALAMQRAINTDREEPLTAIMPALTLTELWQLLGVVQKALLGVSVLVLLVSLICILISMLTSLNERRREMAILRSLGARPHQIVGLLLGETALLVVSGALLGFGLLQVFLLMFGDRLLQNYGLLLSPDLPNANECLIFITILASALLVSLWPAWRAYRLTLSDGLRIQL